MSKPNGLKKIAFHGIAQNPTFVLVLGMCPTIKKTVNVSDAFFLGLATMVVLVFSNIVISLLRRIIPDKVRLPVYIIIIASFVTLIEIFLKSELADKYVPGLYDSLGEMISLIAVNCIIFSRVESFASKNSVLESAVDGLSMGLGFVFSLVLMGAIRQGLSEAGFAFFATTAGGFLLLGLMMAFFNMIYERVNRYVSQRGRSLMASLEEGY